MPLGVVTSDSGDVRLLHGELSTKGTVYATYYHGCIWNAGAASNTGAITAKFTSSSSKLTTTVTVNLDVTILGDVEQDGKVNNKHLALIAGKYSSSGCCATGAACYACDLDGDGDVDGTDSSLMMNNWLSTRDCPCSP